MAPFYNSFFATLTVHFYSLGRQKQKHICCPMNQKNHSKIQQKTYLKYEFGYIDKLWCLLPVKVSIFG